MKRKYFLYLIMTFFAYYAVANVEEATTQQNIHYAKYLPVPGIITPDIKTTDMPVIVEPQAQGQQVSIEAQEQQILTETQGQQVLVENQEQVATTPASNQETLQNLAPQELTALITLLGDNARVEELKNNLTLLQKAAPINNEEGITENTEQNIASIPQSFTQQIKASIQKFYEAMLKLPSSKIVNNTMDVNSLAVAAQLLLIFIGLMFIWVTIKKLITLLQTYSFQRHGQKITLQLFYGILTFLSIGIIWILGMFVLPYISIFKENAIKATQILLPSVIIVLLLDNAVGFLFSLRLRGIRLIAINNYTNKFIIKHIRKFLWFPLALFLIVYVLRRLPNQPALEVRTVLQLCAGIFFIFGVYRFILLLKRLIKCYYETYRFNIIKSQLVWLYDWLVYSWHYLAISYLIIVSVYWFSDFSYRRVWLLENTIGLIFVVLLSFTLWRIIYCLAYNIRKPLSRLNKIVIEFLIIMTALFIVLRNLGFDVTQLLQGEQGEIILTRSITLIILFIFWYIITTVLNSMVNKYLTTTDQEGSLINDNGRLRTILPLIKNIILIGVSLIIILIALSSINVNIMPLLAGAGVVGIAIGFGSQKLVADFITGIFNLIEDTMQVGDVVEINGLSGTVDSLSVRSVRLRDASGNVHTIPFSAVEQVSNLTREFSFAVIDIGVGYNENVDYVFEVLSEIGESMRCDQPWSFYIVEDLEIFGLDSFGDSSVNIRARFKTRPGKQFGIRREFNRRIKNTFDEKGIQIPYPHLTLYYGDQASDTSSSSKQASKEIPIAVIDEEHDDEI